MKILRSLYINNRFFFAVGVLALLFILSFVIDSTIWIPKVLFYVFLGIILTDTLLLFRVKRGLNGHRDAPDKLSNGDDNPIRIHLENFYSFPVTLRIFDELPHQFQRRDLEFDITMKAGASEVLVYDLRPVKRGEYSFGAVNVLVSSPLKILARKFSFSGDKMVPVYPSYIQMRKYELLAISNRLTEVGIKKIRKIGQNQEFELIKEYVSGDDIRTINWKASARKSRLMVNQYQDERSQQVYSLIDKGRVMQMPFNGLSLLDYAINATLVISNIAIKKFDKAGLITFQDTVGTILPASRRNNQMSVIQEVLYHQKTAFRESDLSRLHTQIRSKINQRSLLLLFTNFESIYAMERQLPYLKSLSQRHLLVVVFFENTEMKSLLENPAETTKDIYYKAVAEKFTYDKKLIVKELKRNGIQSILSTPEQLTVNTINKYLELKARNLI
ncbi:DUF58 domain-containing protein [soil metagenome]